MRGLVTVTYGINRLLRSKIFIKCSFISWINSLWIVSFSLRLLNFEAFRQAHFEYCEFHTSKPFNRLNSGNCVGITLRKPKKGRKSKLKYYLIYKNCYVMPYFWTKMDWSIFFLYFFINWWIASPSLEPGNDYSHINKYYSALFWTWFLMKFIIFDFSVH